MGYDLNFLSNNVDVLNLSKNELKCLNTLGRKSQIMAYHSGNSFLK